MTPLCYLEANGDLIFGVYLLHERGKKRKGKGRGGGRFEGRVTFRRQGFAFARTYFFCFGGFTCSGTPSGDVIIVNSTNMRIQTTVKKAHLGIVTALAFSPDSRFEDDVCVCVCVCISCY